MTPYTCFYKGTLPQLPDNATSLSGAAAVIQRLDFPSQRVEGQQRPQSSPSLTEDQNMR